MIPVPQLALSSPVSVGGIPGRLVVSGDVGFIISFIEDFEGRRSEGGLGRRSGGGELGARTSETDKPHVDPLPTTTAMGLPFRPAGRPMKTQRWKQMICSVRRRKTGRDDRRFPRRRSFRSPWPHASELSVLVLRPRCRVVLRQMTEGHANS